MPATNVPGPRPSPFELFGSVVKLTFALTRLPYPKSARPAWIPESTIAIVGGFQDEVEVSPARARCRGAPSARAGVFQDEIELSPLQVCDAPDSYGHSCAEL